MRRPPVLLPAFALVATVALALAVACQPGPSGGVAPPKAAPSPAATTPPRVQALPGFDEYYWNPEKFGVNPVQNRGGTLTYAVAQGAAHLDPSVEISIGQSATLSSVYDRLVVRRLAPGINPLDSEVICRLCESWKLEDDRVTYTFKLRDNVNWHDGRPLVARDIETTMLRLRNRNVNAGAAATGAAAFAPVERIVIRDDKNFQLVTREPFATFIEILESAWIVPAHVYTGPDDAETLRTRAVGTGPFKLAQFIKDQGYILEKNTDYWVPGRPWLDRIQINIIPDKSTRTAGFIARQLDISGASDVTELEPIQRAVPDLGVQSYQSILNNGFEINLKRRPWDDVNVRLALSYAFDREAMNQQLTKGTGKGVFQAPMVSNLRPFSLTREELFRYTGYDSTPARKAQDRQLGRELLARAGFPNGLQTEGKTCRAFSSTPQTLEAAAPQAATVGIQMRVNLLESAVCTAQRTGGEFELFVFPLRGSGTVDNAFAALTTGNPLNIYGVSDPEYDQIYRQSRGEFDRTKRFELYKRMQRIVIEKAYHISLIDLQPQYIWQRWVHNAREYELGVQPYIFTTTAEVVWVERR